jgi:hypothetical protein
MTPPDENNVMDAATVIIKATQVPVLGSFPPVTEMLKAATYNRWIFGMTIGQVMDRLRADNDNQRINGWSVGMASWIPSNVKTQGGQQQTPCAGFTPGFDDAVTDVLQGGGRDYKKRVDGVLKIWQVY